ncbi:MAG: bifunctional riboflavin kinase/FAD synthetase [Kiritimatiellae bacterium]|nr:bifunctional riboflavin kinase/FAD synthetase [Kiritimatiellia bacterium]
MKVLRHLESLRHESSPIILAAGFFDGVHLGHQAILKTTRNAAASYDAENWVLTFDIHPRSVVGDAPPPLLTCNKHKLMLLKRFGIQGCLLLPFTREFASTPAPTFVNELLNSVPTLTQIVVGMDWHFGEKAQGNATLLKRLAGKCGIAVEAVTAVCRETAVVSSTGIRAAVTEGRLQDAAADLGRPFSILGTVIHGEALGRKLGFPTANLACDNEALPPKGVYAVHAAVGEKIYDGVLNLGTRPTVGGNPNVRVIELHLIGEKQNLYGQDIEVFFINRLRDEQHFDSIEIMCNEIKNDVMKTRRILAEKNLKDRLYTHCFSVI